MMPKLCAPSTFASNAYFVSRMLLNTLRQGFLRTRISKNDVNIRSNQGFWIYFILQDKTLFCVLEVGDLSADWSISRLQSWTCSSLPLVAEFVKLTQSIVIEIQWQSADLYKVQLCNRQFFCGVHSDLRDTGIRVSPAWSNGTGRKQLLFLVFDWQPVKKIDIVTQCLAKNRIFGDYLIYFSCKVYLPVKTRVKKSSFDIIWILNLSWFVVN